MSNRPTIQLICGISNLQFKKEDPQLITDPRYQYHDQTLLEENLPRFYNQERPQDFIQVNDVLIKDWVKKPILSEKELNLAELKASLKGKTFEDIIHWSAELGNGSVIGVVLDSEHSTTGITYALTTLFPEFDINGPGFKELPALTLGEDPSAVFLRNLMKWKKNDERFVWNNLQRLKKDYRNEIVRANKIKKRIQNSQSYRFFLEHHDPIYNSWVLLKHFGLNVPIQDLKLMLVCTWG